MTSDLKKEWSLENPFLLKPSTARIKNEKFLSKKPGSISRKGGNESGDCRRYCPKCGSGKLKMNMDLGDFDLVNCGCGTKVSHVSYIIT